jgi:hypothetical protein
VAEGEQASPGARAVDACDIDDVFLVHVGCSVDEEFIPNPALTQFGCVHKFTVEPRALLQTRKLSDPPDTVVHAVRYYARGEVSILKADAPAPNLPEVKPEHILATISHLFAVDYVCPESLLKDRAAVSAFSKNVAFNAWPFWREAVLSDCARLRLPKVMIPMMKPNQPKQVAAKQE